MSCTKMSTCLPNNVTGRALVIFKHLPHCMRHDRACSKGLSHYCHWQLLACKTRFSNVPSSLLQQAMIVLVPSSHPAGCCSKLEMSKPSKNNFNPHQFRPGPAHFTCKDCYSKTFHDSAIAELQSSDGASVLVYKRHQKLCGNLALWCRRNSRDSLGAGACAWQHCHGPAGTHRHHLCCLPASLWQRPPRLLA